MDLRTLTQGAPWMTDEERSLAKDLLWRLRKLFKERGVAETPLMVLRVDDLCVSLLLAKRAEEALAPNAGLGTEQTKGSGERGSLTAAVESAGRTRERLRKAMKELEEACAKMGTPVDVGLADRMRPLLKRTAGILEEAASRASAAPASDRADPADPSDPATE